MGLFKDQTIKTIFFCLILACLVYIYIVSQNPTLVKEGFISSSDIPLDAENPTLTNGQIYGSVPAAASASIFTKKDTRDKANKEDLPFDKATGKYFIETSTVNLNPDPNDIQTVLEKKFAVEGFASPQEIAASAALDEAQKVVQDKVQDKLLKTKLGEKAANVVVKNVTKANAAITSKLGNRVGSKLAKKLAEKTALKIGELVGKRAATATALGAVQTATPDPSGISQAFGVMLTVIGAVGLTAQIVISTVLKGEEGFCPAGYERLNGAIPPFLTKVPGVGDILDVMGAYVCYRNACEPNEDEDAGLCYDKCDKGYKGVGPVCWANSNDVGVGQLKECPPGWTNDGLTCREPISTSLEPCPAGSKDVAGTCWGKSRTCVGGCGGDCGRWKCCGCSWSYDRDVVTKNLGERNMKTTGGAVKGRAAGSDLPCPKTHPNQIDGLCYANCPSDTPNRVAGMPYLCSAAASVGDGRGKTSYGRGVGRPKLKMKPVEKDTTPAPAPPPESSSAAFAADPKTTCKADFSSTEMLKQMASFYYKSAAKVPEIVSGGIKVTYISRISKIIASSEQSCDVLCDITTITLPSATSKVPSATTTVKDKTRRFYFAKIASKCLFVVTAATNVDDTGKELSFPDATPISVNYMYNPFA